MAGGVVRALPGWIRAGVVVQVGAAAGVQFAEDRGFAFRVIRPHDWDTCTGYVWLDGYQLNAAGVAVQRRSIFVEIDGLSPAPAPHRPAGTVQRPRRDRRGTDGEAPP